MSLIRSARLSLFLFASLAVACSGPSSELFATEAASSTESELKVTATDSSKSLTVTSADSACAPFKSLLDEHFDEVKALCGDGEIALPGKIEEAGCQRGSVKSVTFGCFIAKLPPLPPPNQCRPLVVKNESGGSTCGAGFGSDLAGIVCPRLSGMEPPPPPPPPPPPANGVGGEGRPIDVPPPSAPPGAGAGLPEAPRFECCAPPAGPPGQVRGGDTSSSKAPAMH